MTVRMVNGLVVLELPDDPNVGEGPTRFDMAPSIAELEAITAGLPVKARQRMRILMRHHERHLEEIATEVERDRDWITANQTRALEARQAVERAKDRAKS